MSKPRKRKKNAFSPKKIHLLFVFGIVLTLAYIFNLSSNAAFLLNQNGDLLIKSGNYWVKPDNHKQKLDPKLLHKEKNVSIYRLGIKRNSPTIWGKILASLGSGKVMIFEFSPDNEFKLIADENSKFSPISSAKALKSSESNFVLNSNFYGSNNQIVGELVLNGRKYRNESRASGFFRVIDGVPMVGPRSIFSNIKGTIDYSCQAFPAVINNREIFPYILTEKKPSNPLWRKKTYRNLAGMKANGNIVFILSHKRGLLSVKEISLLARHFELERATLFDGGVALQYEFQTPDKKISFSAFNNTVSLGKRTDDYFMRKYKMNFIQKSPVYIGVRLKN